MHLLSLCVSLLLAAPPTMENPLRSNIGSITSIAQITLVHINNLRREWPPSPPISYVTSIQGLTGMCHDLGLLNQELQSPFMEVLGQIRADVSGLEGQVCSHALAMSCPVQARAAAATATNRFPIMRLYETLTQVQSYLEMILLHKDKLKVC